MSKNEAELDAVFLNPTYMPTDTSHSNDYRLTVKGIAAYLSLWAATFAVIRFLAKYSSIGAKGSYHYTAGMVTTYGLPVAIGLFFAGVGIAVAFFLGKAKHSRIVGVWCFVLGCLLIPMIWVAVVVLFGLGLIDVD